MPPTTPPDSTPSALERARAARDDALAASAAASESLPELPARWSGEYVRGVREAALAGGMLLAVAYAARSGLLRYRVESDIPGRIVRRGGTLHGYVMRVTDGDGLRFYHTPWLRRMLRPEMRKLRKISNETINVRLAGVDAPELSHYGVPGQPFGKEALDFLRGLAERRRVSLTIHQLDQYKRVLGTVHVKSENPLLRVLGLGGRNVSMELAKAGLAEVYRGPNACYGRPGLRRFEAAQAAAMKARVGMWSQKKVVTPTEFKARLRRVAANGGNGGPDGVVKPKGAAFVLFPLGQVVALAQGAVDVIRAAVGVPPPSRRKLIKRTPAATKKRGLFSLWG
jgi:endonuclease YncB( thermonuclease family)